MKTELVLLIHLVTVTLAVAVPAVNQRATVGAEAIEPVESTESNESLENNVPKVSIRIHRWREKRKRFTHRICWVRWIHRVLHVSWIHRVICKQRCPEDLWDIPSSLPLPIKILIFSLLSLVYTASRYYNQPSSYSQCSYSDFASGSIVD